MNWDDAKLFLTVARNGQIAAAAVNLGINQSTLSRRIATLETSLGTKLLKRRTYGCELTNEGSQFYKTMEEAESVIVTGQATIQKTDFKASGLVRLAAPDGFSDGFLAEQLRSLLDDYPNLKIQLVPEPNDITLAQQGADMAVMVGRPEKGRLIAKKLTDYSLSLYASKDYIELYGYPEDEASLSKLRLIGDVEDLVYSESLSFKNQHIRDWTSTIEVSTVTGRLKAISSGAGIGILPDYLARNNNALVKMFPKSIIKEYWLAWPENQKSLERIKIVSSFLTRLVKNGHFF